MRRWCKSFGLLLFFPAFSVVASSGEIPSVPVVKTLYRASTCYGVEKIASVSLLSKTQLQLLLEKQPQHPKLAEENLVGHIILVNMGEQRTAGYGIGLATEPAQLENGTLRLPVIWQSPKPGMMLAQIITHPCLVVSVAAEFQQVEVVDQNGMKRLSSAGTP